jgi:hypothetical protein
MSNRALSYCIPDRQPGVLADKFRRRTEPGALEQERADLFLAGHTLRGLQHCVLYVFHRRRVVGPQHQLVASCAFDAGDHDARGIAGNTRQREESRIEMPAVVGKHRHLSSGGDAAQDIWQQIEARYADQAPLRPAAMAA